MKAAALATLVIQIAVLVLVIASMWRIFTKAGKPGWAVLVPIYNAIVLLEIVGKPWWWIFLVIIPPISLIFGIIVIVELAKAFGKSGGFAVGLILLGFVFFPILAFGDAEYLGPGGEGRPRHKRVRRDRDGYDDEYDDDFDDRPRKKVSARRDRDDDSDDEEDVDDRPRKRLPPPVEDEFDDAGAKPRSSSIKPAAEKTAPKPPPAVPAPKAQAAGASSVVSCSSCGRKLKVPATAIGKKVKCPGCGNAFVA